jgi:hypothetical protein
MRLALWILLVLNLFLLVATQGIFGSGDTGREPDRMGQQLKPEQLHIIPASDETAVPARPAAEAQSAPLPVPPVAELACKRIDGLAPAEADSLVKAMSDLPDWQTRLLAPEVPMSYRVAIPGLASRSAAEKKRDEVGLLGVKDHEIVEQGTNGPFLVSFARLPDEAAAKDLLQGLQKKGVRSARVLAQPAEEKKAVELRAPAAILNQKLPELAALFAAASVGDCAAP